MITFLALAHMLDPTQLDLGVGGGRIRSLRALPNMLDATQLVLVVGRRMITFFAPPKHLGLRLSICV